MFIIRLLSIAVAESVLPKNRNSSEIELLFCLRHVYTFLARNSKKVLR